MIESLPTVLSLITTAAKAMNWFSDLQKTTKGEVRALIEELKENSRLCFRVVEDGVSPEEVIPKFSTMVFDRLNENGFDFNATKRKCIPALEGIEETDLASWSGKSTQELIENIYDKIKDIRSLQLASASTTRRLGPRVINIHKRILLLLRHAKS